MSLRLFISNDIEKLAVKLADNIKTNPLKLYQKEVVVVQTEGMSSWVAMKITETNNIFSNFEFLSPNNLLFELFRFAGIYNPGLYDTNNLKWLIFKILEGHEFTSKFYGVYQYYENDKIKQLQLATKLADLFDQYVIYRPDYIRQWNKNESPQIKSYLSIHEKWQKWIWLKIKDTIGNNAIDKVQMRDALLDKFKDEHFVAKVKLKFPRISLFSFSLITLFHVEVFFTALKEIIDIDFYLTNPSPEDFWFRDIKDKTRVKIEKSSDKTIEDLKLTIGNKLLMNQGRTAKDLFNMLFDIDEIFNVMDNDSLVNPPQDQSLLHSIQRDIYYNTGNSDRKTLPVDLLNDGSIRISANYTPVREVETLYNYILKQIDENDYKLKDIIVLTTNIDLYTPIIKAVFDNADYKIPYTIADRSYDGNDNLIGILKQLLSLQKDEFTSEEVLQLLDYDIIRKKFNINNIKTIRTLVKQANIRHGISGDIENDTLFVSWKYGLERILLGYAINSDSLLSSPNGGYDILPLDIVEGEYAKEGLKLKYFVDTLIYFVTNRSKSRTISEWRNYIFELIDKVLEIGDDTTNDLNYIFDKLTFPEEVLDILNDKISYEVFFKAFIDSLYSNNRVGKFISGKITFCSMIPMRSIPYKVIAVLGLNAKAFPRKQTDISFDLKQYERRKGDRNVKETDKYLFFETLLSAKEKLFLSYLGINIKDNTELPPSLVIDELIDYISAKSEVDITTTSLIVKHTIDNYNKKYYSESFPDYYTYLSYGMDKRNNDLFTTDKKETDSGKYLLFADLIKFIKNPTKWFFTNTLNINYFEDSILLPESEIFELNTLEKHLLKTELTNNQKLQDYTTDLKKKIIAGELPLKNMGKFEVKNTIKELQSVLDYLNSIKAKKTSTTVEFEVEINHSIIHGEIDNVYGDEIIIVELSSDYIKSLALLKLYSWICISADIPVKNFILLHYNKDKSQLKTKSIKTISKEEAILKLNGLLELFLIGKTTILPFLPQASYEYLRKYKGKSKKQGNPLQIFIKILEKKSEFDRYIEKAMDKNIFQNSDENLILDAAKLFFNDDF